MKKINLRNFMMVVAAILVLYSCDKENNDPIVSEVTTTVDATSYSDWVYYSFSEDTIVDVVDPKTSTNWDIGLMRNHLKTNSGSSGNGDGGAYDAGVVDFDLLLVAPETGYVVDDSVAAFSMATMEYTNIAASSVLETWGSFTEDTPPLFEFTNNVFVIKTPLGNYAKVIFLNYYGTEGSGYITFKYLYQSDGSTTLE